MVIANYMSHFFKQALYDNMAEFIKRLWRSLIANEPYQAGNKWKYVSLFFKFTINFAFLSLSQKCWKLYMAPLAGNSKGAIK